ncbi:methyltransferase domain-containing protein [soil metagenome]
MSHHHEHDHSHETHDHDADGSGLAELLDLDAEVLAGPLNAVRDDIASLLDAPLRSILDLGAGTGTGTFGLLEHFPEAHALAIDGSSDMLERLRQRAEQRGLSERVTTLQADLDEGVPGVDAVDLAWASASLHHLADPDRTLTQVVGAIRPGGLLAVVELTDFTRFLDDGTPGGDAEANAHALMASDRAADLPAMGSDWGSRLTRAGFVIELDRAIAVDLAPPLADVVGAYAFASLTRIRGALGDRLEAADREQLDRLLDGGSSDVRHRDDLHVRTDRQLRIARRPAAAPTSTAR